MVTQIATHFFREGAVKIDTSFEKTDLYKFLTKIYGPLVYVSEPGFFISVCKKGNETYLTESNFFNSRKQINEAIFKKEELIEVGCWVPLVMRKYIYRKKPDFSNDIVGFNLSRQGYHTIDLEEGDLDFIKTKWDKLEADKLSKFFHKYLPKNVLFQRLELSYSNNVKNTKKTESDPVRMMGYSGVVGLITNVCTDKVSKFLKVGTYSWYDKYIKDAANNALDDSVLEKDFLNPPHAEIELKLGKAVLVNLFNPKFYYAYSSSGKHSTIELIGADPDITAQKANQSSN